jgi:hypothetical protein
MPTGVASFFCGPPIRPDDDGDDQDYERRKDFHDNHRVCNNPHFRPVGHADNPVPLLHEDEPCPTIEELLQLQEGVLDGLDDSGLFHDTSACRGSSTPAISPPAWSPAISPPAWSPAISPPAPRPRQQGSALCAAAKATFLTQRVPNVKEHRNKFVGAIIAWCASDAGGRKGVHRQTDPRSSSISIVVVCDSLDCPFKVQLRRGRKSGGQWFVDFATSNFEHRRELICSIRGDISSIYGK